MLIHLVNNGFYAGQSLEIDDRSPIPKGWVVGEAVPEVPQGYAAKWDDGWHVIVADQSPNSLIAEPDWATLAKNALEQSDRVAIRTLKAGMLYPEEWLVYDDKLRAIVNGAPGPLPTPPDYPESSVVIT